MKKISRTGLTIVIAIISLSLVVFLVIFIAERRISNAIGEELSGLVQYETLEVSLIKDQVRMRNAKLQKDNIEVNAGEIGVYGFGLYEYWFNGKMVVEKVSILSPDIIVSHPEEKAPEPVSGDFGNRIRVKNLELNNGNLRIRKAGEEQLYFRFPKFRLEGVRINSESLKNKIPFSYRAYALQGDSLHFRLNAEHFLTMGSIRVDNGKTSAENVKVIPRYGKTEHQRHIPYEKDRIDLAIEKVDLDSLTFSFENDSLVLRNTALIIDGADMEIYRDKLQPDDTRFKPLYSRMIRELPVKIDLAQIEVRNSAVIYEERTKESGPPAKVSFSELNATISDVTNTALERQDFPETIIAAHARFMGSIPVEVDWSFNSRDVRDAFTVSAVLGKVDAPSIDPFLKPAMNITAEGTINSVAMTFSGNNDRALGDMRLEYEGFKVNVLKEDGTERSGFLSALANLFVKNDGLNRELLHEDLEVNRDKTKSFWNFLWLCLRKGVLEHLVRI